MDFHDWDNKANPFLALIETPMISLAFSTLGILLLFVQNGFPKRRCSRTS
jgi:hypothetical protein